MDGTSEKEPLLCVKDGSTHSSSRRTSSADSERSGKSRSSTPVKMKRHITLPYAIAIIVGNVIGSGIFLSPKGVTQNIGSVGGSLIVWGVTGLYNLCQALCYAELGCLIPKSGGDYSYLFYILGPLPAFMCAWIHIVIIASSSCAVIARTAALYLIEPLGLQCYTGLITGLAIFIIVSLATVNGLSSKWGTRIHTFFTVAKCLALLTIITVGVVKMSQGYTLNFVNAFAGTTDDPGLMALSVLDGYFAYKGWDLPIAVWIGLTLVTGIYVLTNMAYFSVLSTQELLQSDAIALTFADRAMGSAKLIIPIAVFLSCSGTVNGDFLSNSRYLFAGGRFKQVPQLFSFIHLKLLTPIPAIAALCVIAVIYCVFTDLTVLQEYASLSVQAKMLLVNLFVVTLTLLVMAALVGLSFYKSPLTSGIGAAMYFLGIPIFYLGKFLQKRKAADLIMDKWTRIMQKTLLLVPETKTAEDEDIGIVF